MASRFSKITFILFIFLIGFFFQNQIASAFLYIRGSTFLKGARPVNRAMVWPNRTVKFYVNPTLNAYGGSLSTAITSAQFLEAVNAAISAWSEACNADFTVELMGTTTALDSGSDSVNVIAYDNQTQGEGNTFGASTGTLAAAFSVSNSVTDEFIDCDIVVNGNFAGTFDTTGASDKYDLASTLAHEVGHCLGLDHPVEPPTYTSTNSFLLTATMVQTAVAGIGSTFRRTLGQDDIDGFECVYQRGKSLKNGDGCFNYHGTNDQGAITGEVVGGPTAERLSACTISDKQAVSFFTRSTLVTGSGCVSSAFASSTKVTDKPSPWFHNWMFLPGFSLLLIYLFRKRRKWPSSLGIFLVVLFSMTVSPKLFADPIYFEIGGEYRFSKPDLLDRAAEMDGTRNWSGYNKSDKFRRFQDIRAAFGRKVADHLYFGGFLRYLTSNQVIHEAMSAASDTLTTKTTSYSGLSGGVLLHGDIEVAFVSFFSNVGLGIGQRFIYQEITGPSDNKLTASADSGELFGEIGVSVQVLSLGSIFVSGGYVREKTNAFSVSTVSGSLYSGLSSDSRLYVNKDSATHELRVDRSGAYLFAGISFLL